MPFDYEWSPEMEADLKAVGKKNKPLALLVLRKIQEVVSRDLTTIQFYKNLRAPLNRYKRVHVADSFVLAFRVLPELNQVLFARFCHHDDVYRELLKTRP